MQDRLGGERPRPLTKEPVKGSSINLATIRRDGFASIYCGYFPGELTTPLLTFAGTELEVNAVADHGEIRVEVLDESNNPIPGLTRDECIPFAEDSVRGKIKWKAADPLKKLQGKPVRLKFCMTMARLYAFKCN
jgi:hypothetical protein